MVGELVKDSGFVPCEMKENKIRRFRKVRFE